MNTSRRQAIRAMLPEPLTAKSRVKDMADKLGKSYVDISVWFHTTAKKIKEIKKVAPGKFAWAS